MYRMVCCVYIYINTTFLIPWHRNHYGCSLLFLSESPEVFVPVPYYILGLSLWLDGVQGFFFPSSFGVCNITSILYGWFHLSIIPMKICSFKSFFLLITILLCRCWKMVPVMMFCHTDFVNNIITVPQQNTLCDLYMRCLLVQSQSSNDIFGW